VLRDDFSERINRVIRGFAVCSSAYDALGICGNNTAWINGALNWEGRKTKILQPKFM
jgi:hypothetical protein